MTTAMLKIIHPSFRRRAGALLLLTVCLAGMASAADRPAEWTDRGLRLLHGEGVTADPDRALVYLCAAAHRGHGPAAFELGWHYLQGRDAPRDDGLGLAWLREAERLGEALPDRLMAGLSSVVEKAPACVNRNGQELPLNDRRRVELVLAIYELAPEYSLDPGLVLEVVRAESNFNPKARSHKGALGLMQLIPATAKRFGVKDPFEPLQNLHGGMAYLRWLLERFDGDLPLSLAGYNAGEAAVERHGGIPPYSETREYVARILQRYHGTAGGSVI